MLLEWGEAEHSRSPFLFLKVHNKLGKVTKFGTSRHIFTWRNGRLKKVRADSATPHPYSVKTDFNADDLIYLYRIHKNCYNCYKAICYILRK